ncbi:MAG: aldo/keto reductase [Bacteroidota bacterium]
MSIEARDFGSTGLKVSPLGLGCGNLGRSDVSEKAAENLLQTALDLGVTLIDTARGYGRSEERIGKYLSKRRTEFILSTKVGYGIPGYRDWTPECVVAGVHEALRLLKTDRIDIVHFHSCPKETLQQDGMIDALLSMVEQGKISVAAYSGENEHLEYAVGTGRFRSMQCSINVCDQRTIDHPLPQAKERGMGVIAKRPVANAPWRFAKRPVGQYVDEYWKRWKAMNLEFGMDCQELALRFAAFTWGVDSCVLGTTNAEHLRQSSDAIQKGPLPKEIYAQIRDAFRKHDSGWTGQI